jgi:hypothetical protein
MICYRLAPPVTPRTEVAILTQTGMMEAVGSWFRTGLFQTSVDLVELRERHVPGVEIRGDGHGRSPLVGGRGRLYYVTGTVLGSPIRQTQPKASPAARRNRSAATCRPASIQAPAPGSKAVVGLPKAAVRAATVVLAPPEGIEPVRRYGPDPTGSHEKRPFSQLARPRSIDAR